MVGFLGCMYAHVETGGTANITGKYNENTITTF